LHIAKLSPSPLGEGLGVGYIGLRRAERPHPLPLP
jgi:hypothetical protein